MIVNKQFEFSIVILTTQEANSIVISKAQPKVQSSILKISQSLSSTNNNIISGAVLNIVGITVL
jgi:hypothetical protein